jgi:hypothetical protein
MHKKRDSKRKRQDTEKEKRERKNRKERYMYECRKRKSAKERQKGEKEQQKKREKETHFSLSRFIRSCKKRKWKKSVESVKHHFSGDPAYPDQIKTNFCAPLMALAAKQGDRMSL